jgi:hypothetical protein
MHTDRIQKVLDLVAAAEPSLPIPIATGNISISNITPVTGKDYNTDATFGAIDQDIPVQYRGSTVLNYGRIDISHYFPNNVVYESPNLSTYADLLAELNARHQLDVYADEIHGSDTALPQDGQVTIAINDANSPAYCGTISLLFSKDTGLLYQRGIEYTFVTQAALPILGYVETQVSGLQYSINGSVWSNELTLTKTNNGRYAVRPTTSVAINALTTVRLRGADIYLQDVGNVDAVQITGLLKYRSTTNGRNFCSGITTLTYIADDCFIYATDLTSADNFFYGCVGLTTIPSKVFGYCEALITAKGCFSGTGLASVPAQPFGGATNLKYLDNVYANCTSLASVSADAFLGLYNVLSASRAFAGCTSLTSIPNSILTPLTAIQDVSYFIASTGITAVDKTFFNQSTTIQDISGIFYRLGLTSLPQTLLTGMTALNRMDYFCYGCSGITVLPYAFLDGLSQLEYADYAFSKTGIIQLPNNFFTNCRRLLSIDYLFDGCSALLSIPTGFLAPLQRLVSAVGIWHNCTSLTSLPADILTGNPNLVTVQWLFYNTNITSIPTGALSGLTGAKDITGLFAGTRISSVPDGLLSAATNLEVAAQLFWKCSLLTTIPATTFSTNTALISAYGVFAGCSLLAGVITSWFGNNASLKQVSGMLQGCTAITGSLTALRTQLTSVDWLDNDYVEGVIALDTQLTDYASVGIAYKTTIADLL